DEVVLVVPHDAEGAAAKDEVAHELDDLEAPGAAIDEVAEEDEAAVVAVRPAAADVVAELVAEGVQRRELSVEGADDVDGGRQRAPGGGPRGGTFPPANGCLSDSEAAEQLEILVEALRVEEAHLVGAPEADGVARADLLLGGDARVRHERAVLR